MWGFHAELLCFLKKWEKGKAGYAQMVPPICIASIQATEKGLQHPKKLQRSF